MRVITPGSDKLIWTTGERSMPRITEGRYPGETEQNFANAVGLEKLMELGKSGVPLPDGIKTLLTRYGEATGRTDYRNFVWEYWPHSWGEWKWSRAAG
jgi:hypothetical protein